MQHLFIAARVLALLLAMPAALGTAWFYPTLSPTMKAYSAVTIPFFLLTALSPRRWYSFALFRAVLLGLCAAGITLMVRVIGGDLSLVGGADWPAAVLGSLEISVMSVLGLEVALNRRLLSSPLKDAK
jgi:hypothetical protein